MTPAVKLTDALNTPDASRDGKVNLVSIVPRYPSIFGFNLDSSSLLLHHGGYYAVYDGAGKYLRDLPFEVAGTNANPVWSRSAKDVLYFISGNSVKACNSVTRVITLVKQFSEYTSLFSFGEADISDDGRYLVLAGDGKNVFTFNLSTKVKGPAVDLPGIESIHMTPLSNVLVKYHPSSPPQPAATRFSGCELFTSNMVFVRQVIPYNPHADMMLDEALDEILVHSNGNDPAPKLPAPSYVTTRLKDSFQKAVFKSDWALASHFSCPTGRDFFFAGRYDPEGHIEGEILKIWLNGLSEVLALHRSKPFPGDDYEYQPKPSCNRTGDRVVFSSNFGKQPVVNYTDTYMLSLAATAPVPPPVPVPPVSEFVYALDQYNAEIKGGKLIVRKI